VAKISKIWAREVLDSRGLPTVEAVCQLDTGQVSVASVPAGASTGTYEAVELRDGDPARFLGKGVLKAVENVNGVLGSSVWGYEVAEQDKIDQRLLEIDGTKNKAKYGANASLAISIACSKAAALSANVPLYQWIRTLCEQHGITQAVRVPTPVFNMINGGLHGAGNLDFQEFHVIPASSKPYSEALRMGVEIYIMLGRDLARRGAIHSVGDEGGYAPNLFTNADALEVIYETIKETNYQIGRDVFLGLDVAADEFYKDGEYTIRDKSAPLTGEGLLEYYKYLNSQYHLAHIEDPFHEDAWESWTSLSESFAGQLSVVGDDLLVTNQERVEKAIREKACNVLLVKPNQVGTLSETLKVIKIAREAGWKLMASHRSGETNDWFIADFAVGIGAEFAKFGAPCRGERVVKYNRLLSIESELGSVVAPAPTL
jgi:enolase